MNTTEENYFVNPNGLKLLKHIWLPDGECKALVFIIHGLSEHASFYYGDTIVMPLVQMGCIVAAHDHLGHGGSDGDRRLVSSVEGLARDVIAHVEYLKNVMYSIHLKDRPIFLYGHSMGGLIACKVVISQPNLITGLLLEAPAIVVAGENARYFSMKLKLAGAIAKLMPAYVLRRPANIKEMLERLTNNSEVAIKALKDPLRNQRGLAIGTAVNIARAAVEIRTKLNEIEIPIFCGHGGCDPIVPVNGSFFLHSKVSSEDKTLVIYDNELHILRAESQCDFRHRVCQWIFDRLDKTDSLSCCSSSIINIDF